MAILFLLLVAIPLIAAEPESFARWDFDGKDEISLVAHGGIKRGALGPIAPEFPHHSTNNRALRLDGNGARLMLADPNGRFSFTNGQAITIEAWVRLDGRKENAPIYVIGKGRTGSGKFSPDNQNWALRIVHSGGAARLSFLFATSKRAGSSHWRRWTSRLGFDAKTGWHHVAVAYHFGNPKSIRGWIDGVRAEGGWDLGGETKAAPVSDGDDVWIGSALNGSTGNSFRGWLDAVAIHRRALDDKVIAGRFKRVGGPQIIKIAAGAKPETKPLPEEMPEINDVPRGRVLVTIGEGFPTEVRWRHEGENDAGEIMRWMGDEFILPRIPIRYDEYGIRAAWQVPLLVRMAGDIRLPPGTQRFMMRTRALSRLWIDGQLVARGKPITKQPPNGEEPVTPVRQPPLPGLRVAGYHQQEVFGEAVITNKISRVVFETVVGGAKLRPETGEILIALQTSDKKFFSILRSGQRPFLPLTDDATIPVLNRIQASLADFDDANRRRLAATLNNHWNRRRESAQTWASNHPAPKVPLIAGINHPIDAFITAKIRNAISSSNSADREKAERFHSDILPLLRRRCFRCHGEKEKGGLKLDTREELLDAVIPGKPHKSELMIRVLSEDDDERMPPTGDPLNKAQIALLTKWIKSGATWPQPPINPAQVKQHAVMGDTKFVRRVYLDTIGIPPTSKATADFVGDTSPDKRGRLIRRLTNDERAADHWTSYWQDMLAENPALLNQAQGATGPFRWFIHESLRDNKPLDRMVTELIMLRGGKHEGGAAGFGMAAENDSPFAAKGHIIASAFLGIELQCARCHDPPYHSTTQRDLYSLAAMFQRKPIGVPKTSRVPAEFFENRKSRALIQVTLKPGEQVPPKWRFAKLTGADDDQRIDALMRDPKDTRERMATLITSPGNRRFASVVVNRIWKRLLGAGLVEPVHDWEQQKPSHPALLNWLAHKLVADGYNPIPIIRLILSSDSYQRPAIEGNLTAPPETRFFNGPERRRLTAEQIVDSLFVVTGTEMDIGELTFVHDGKRPLSNRQTLGYPKRAWMLADLNNERDRPSLSLPRARAIVDVLEAFGWKGARQQPIYHREIEANVLQPGVLANGVLVASISRASAGSELAQLALDAKSESELVDRLFLQILSRQATKSERSQFITALKPGFQERRIPSNRVKPLSDPKQLPLITWFNHLRHDANSIQQQLERRVRQGPSPDPRLKTAWRERFEDIVWSLINHREFVWMP